MVLPSAYCPLSHTKEAGPCVQVPRTPWAYRNQDRTLPSSEALPPRRDQTGCVPVKERHREHGENLAFVKDRQVVLVIKQILEFLLCFGPALTVAATVSKTLLVPAFKVYYRIVGYRYRHEADVFGWTGVQAQRVFSSSRSQTWLPNSGQL